MKKKTQSENGMWWCQTFFRLLVPGASTYRSTIGLEDLESESKHSDKRNNYVFENTRVYRGRADKLDSSIRKRQGEMIVSERKFEPTITQRKKTVQIQRQTNF
jgi:hypothetical protein